MSVNQGGRPSKDLSGFKELIEELYLNQQLSAENIRHQLATEYNTVVSTRTLRSAIANWGFYKTTSLEDTPELRIYISTCFYLLGLEDNEIAHVLLLPVEDFSRRTQGRKHIHYRSPQGWQHPWRKLVPEGQVSGSSRLHFHFRGDF